VKKLKRSFIILIVLFSTFAIYVLAVNRNSVNMNTRQKILKAVYPALMWFTKLTGTKTAVAENKKIVPPVSFYGLQATANDSSNFSFETLKGKKVLLVNTASECGYTAQYAELETLYRQYRNQLNIIAFPANDFKEQEKGSDADIAAFCQRNYGVSFPIMAKSAVIGGDQQNPVFKWLTNPALNGWNSKGPSWNFSKFLIDEEGKLVNYFDASVSPLSTEIIQAITKK
jgi:glutathione peroxidase